MAEQAEQHRAEPASVKLAPCPQNTGEGRGVWGQVPFCPHQLWGSRSLSGPQWSDTRSQIPTLPLLNLLCKPGRVARPL